MTSQSGDRLLQVAFAGAPTAMALVGPDGSIAAVNDAWCELVGAREAELVGRPDRLAAPDGGPSRPMLRRPNGTHTQAELTVRAAHDADGREIGSVHTLLSVADPLRERSRFDPLTGLPNREMLEDALGREVARRPSERRLALVLLQPDKLAVDDALVVELAERLARTVRRGELIAHVDGGRFAWLLPDAGPEQAMAASDRARAAVACRPMRGSGPLTISGGVGVVDPPFRASLLHELAERAVDEARRDGGNRTRCALGLAAERPAVQAGSAGVTAASAAG